MYRASPGKCLIDGDLTQPEAYSTDIKPGTVFSLFDADIHKLLTRVGQYNNPGMVNFAQAVMPSMADIKSILQSPVNDRCMAKDLVSLFPAERRRAIFRALSWMLKPGFLKFSP
jgi:hypothetical protein